MRPALLVGRDELKRCSNGGLELGSRKEAHDRRRQFSIDPPAHATARKIAVGADFTDRTTARPAFCRISSLVPQVDWSAPRSGAGVRTFGCMDFIASSSPDFPSSG